MKRVVAFFVILVAMLCVSACSFREESSNNEEVNLDNYIEVSFDGKNHAGYGSVSFNKEQFLLDNIDKITFNKENEKVYEELYGSIDKSPANEVLKYIKVTLEKNNKLSNGDVVEIKWEIDVEKISTYFEFDYAYTSKKFEVSDLTEAMTFDPFETVELYYTGDAPYGEVGARDFKYSLMGKYEITPNNNLKNGDSIKVSYVCADKATMIEQYGIYPSCYEKEFTVSGLKSYIQSIDELSNEEYKKLVEKASSSIWVLGYGKYDDSVYLGNFFYSAKEKLAHGVHFLKWCGFPVGNAMCFVFERPKEIGNELESKKVYTVIAVQNLLVDENGKLVESRYEMWEHNTYESKEDVKKAFIGVFDEFMICTDNVK